MTQLVDGYCHRCHKPLGKVAWDAADFVFHRKCAKADEVYTPPPALPWKFFGMTPLWVSPDGVRWYQKD